MTARAAGFTLIETLVALTVLALLSVVLFGGLRAAQRMQDAGAARARELRDIAAMHMILRGLIGDAAPARRARQIAFVGAPERLSFIAPMPAPLGLAGTQRFSLGLVGQGRAGRLLLTFAPLDGDGPASRSLLLRGVRGIALRYFVAPAGRPARWRRRWAAGPVLPLLVRLQLRLRDRMAVPDLVIALHRAVRRR
ncbi:MAG: prepilin-type N-terminal cleavage/methylation domain-containing protein [Acetobacteraceae bacterium]